MTKLERIVKVTSYIKQAFTVAVLLGGLTLLSVAPTAYAQADVKMVFLGNIGFKFTTPSGKVIFIDPWLKGNADAPFGVADVDKADLILVSGAHGDNRVWLSN